MRSLTTSAEVPLSAADFWALRLDSNFDRFCAAAEGCMGAIADDGWLSAHALQLTLARPQPAARQPKDGALAAALLQQQHVRELSVLQQ